MARGKGRSGRRYVRDNRGRFASKGAGATARGGRLKTAGGNKRATQTMKASGAKAAGTISKPKGLKPGAIKAKPKALKANTKALPAAKPAAAAKPARAKARTALKRTGGKVSIPSLKTNTERGRKGIVSMSTGAKQARRGAVAERKAERRARVVERQSGIVARRQGNRLSTYSPSGAFNQAAQNLNQSKLKKSKQIQSWLTTRNPADKPQSRRQKQTAAKPAAAAKPARRRAAKNAERKASRRAGKAARPQASKVDTSISAIARRRQRAMADRSSIAGGQFNMKLSTRSAITRSAANEIYNRQRQIAKASGGRIDPAVARNATGVLRGISGTKRQRAEQLRERARRRVVSGRRR